MSEKKNESYIVVVRLNYATTHKIIVGEDIRAALNKAMDIIPELSRKAIGTQLGTVVDGNATFPFTARHGNCYLDILKGELVK